jgi:diguanylate cyclase (GGDEF)-like protein
MLQNEIRQAVHAAGHDDVLLESTVAELVEKWGNKVHKEVLTILIGKNLGTDKSTRYWRQALKHRQSIEKKSGWRLSLRSALLDYLQQQVSELTNPVIIEAEFLANIRHSSITDGLTGLFDQLYFKGHLDKTLNKSRRRVDFQAAVVLFDLDHFKQYNDRCGHLAGDDALAMVAEILRTQVRDGDIVARYGGEEFALFLPNTDRTAAFTIAERIRKEISETEFSGQSLLDRGSLTISGGIAAFPDDGEDALTLIDKADKELYKAKIRRDSIFPAKPERRGDQRLKVSSLIEFTRTGRAFDNGVVFDISKSGLAFSCSNDLKREEKITLRFQKPFWRDNFFCEGSVRQVHKLDETGLNFVGLEFETLFDDFIRHIPNHATNRAIN